MKGQASRIGASDDAGEWGRGSGGKFKEMGQKRKGKNASSGGMM